MSTYFAKVVFSFLRFTFPDSTIFFQSPQYDLYNILFFQFAIENLDRILYIIESNIKLIGGVLVTEREFSQRIRSGLQDEGFRVVPIETGGTAVGFPDMFVMGWGVATFVEVKSRPKESVKVVLTRGDILGPGQMMFMAEFNKATKMLGGTGKFCLVVVSCLDGTIVFNVSSKRRLHKVSAWKGLLRDRFDRKLSAAIVNGYFGKGVV